MSKRLPCILHILMPKTDNSPSWIRGKERMIVENISWSITTKECFWPSRGRTHKLLITSLDAHPSEPMRPANYFVDTASYLDLCAGCSRHNNHFTKFLIISHLKQIKHILLHLNTSCSWNPDTQFACDDDIMMLSNRDWFQRNYLYTPYSL